MSRLHRVVACLDGGRVEAVDLEGRRSEISLLAYEGPRPAVGDWLVAQSGYALGAADPDDARAAAADLARARDAR